MLLLWILRNPFRSYQILQWVSVTGNLTGVSNGKEHESQHDNVLATMDLTGVSNDKCRGLYVDEF